MIPLQKKFQGALVGAVVGDCMGNYWEMKPWKGTHDITEVKQKIEDQVNEYKSKKSPIIGYTDDSAMTLVMAKSLIECKGLDVTDMAKRFTEEFFTSPERGYGASVSSVFIDLKNNKYKGDVFAPAQKSFKGQGSCGNGAAMRVSPAALYGYNNEQILIETVKQSSKITHAHMSGINGALLQALSIRHAMDVPSDGSLDVCAFIDSLYSKMVEFERRLDQILEDDEESVSEPAPLCLPPLATPPDPKSIKVQLLRGQPRYTSLLEQIRALLVQKTTPTANEVQELIGHGVLAGEAVPCALYSFLQCANESFEELIPYAISLGGDADTIASMAGAIGGAYWGYDKIPQRWVESCESTDHAYSLADSLYDLVFKS